MAPRRPDRILALPLVLVWLLCAPVLAAAPEVSLLPKPRPARLAVELMKLLESLAPPPDAICGSARIRGERVKIIGPTDRGCGIPQPVRVTAVSGVRLAPAAIIDCKTAQALNSWVAEAAKPAFRHSGGGLAELRVAASYVCRTRNSRPGAKMSEHSLGHAIDISAFTLRDGDTVDVLTGWPAEATGTVLQALHKSACGTFGTVLGPRSDRHHRDHFHFDTARYRAGAYCR